MKYAMMTYGLHERYDRPRRPMRASLFDDYVYDSHDVCDPCGGSYDHQYDSNTIRRLN